MNVILCGYHWTGCNALEWLLEKKHNVFIYTHKTQNSVADLEGLCIKKKVPYSLEKISAENLPFLPDVICSIYYRYIIADSVINIVKGKIFNLHPALLPKYRGCSSLTWAIINGENQCGYTFHYIDTGCDTGNIIIQKSVKIEDYDTQLTSETESPTKEHAGVGLGPLHTCSRYTVGSLYGSSSNWSMGY